MGGSPEEEYEMAQIEYFSLFSHKAFYSPQNNVPPSAAVPPKTTVFKRFAAICTPLPTHCGKFIAAPQKSLPQLLTQ